MGTETTPTERRDEVIRTCELAVTWLTDPERGWEQGTYTEGETVEWLRRPHENVETIPQFDYSHASACLGGALVLSANEGLDYGKIGSMIDTCPAVAEVARTIRALPLARRRFVRLRDYYGRNLPDPEVIYNFNDHDRRTVGEVVEVLNDTIKRMVDENMAEAFRG